MKMQNPAKPKSRPKQIILLGPVTPEKIDAARQAALEISQRAWEERKVANRKKPTGA